MRTSTSFRLLAMSLTIVSLSALTACGDKPAPAPAPTAAAPAPAAPSAAPAAPAAPAPAPAQYTSNFLQGMGDGNSAGMQAGESRAMTFTGPVPDGAYNWQIIAENGSASFKGVNGSFQVAGGVGGFWVHAEPAGPATTFVVEVQKLDGLTLARTQKVSLTLDPQPIGWQPPPPTAIKSRDPVTTGQAMTNSGASPIAGMYVGGVDEAGNNVFVAVPPTGSTTWGSTYNPPASQMDVWTAAEIAAKTKTLVSDEGTPIAYRIWGA